MPLNKHQTPVTLVLLLLVGSALLVASPPAAADTFGAKELCQPSKRTEKSTDGNGDGKPDWLLHTQNDSAGGKVQIWCIDPDGKRGNGTAQNPNNEYYAIVYVAPNGTRYFIGKCPYGGGYNTGHKWHNATGVLVNISWQSEDLGFDDDGDGKGDMVDYFFNVTTGNMTVRHTEGGEVEENSTPVAKDKFGFGDLPPKRPSSDEFWSLAPSEPDFGEGEMTMSGWAVAAVSILVADASGAPAPDRAVEVKATGETVASGTTNGAGLVSFALDTGTTYRIEVEGAAPQDLALTGPVDVDVVLQAATEPAPTGFLPGWDAAASLAAAFGVAVLLGRRRPPGTP